MRSNAILNIENDEKFCFVWSILAHLQPIAFVKNGHQARVSNYRQYFEELKIEGFVFTNGYKCSDTHRYDRSNQLPVNLYKYYFDQVQIKWKHKLIPIEISENDSDKVFNFLLYKNHYALIKKSRGFLGKNNRKFVCRRSLSSYTSENMLMIRTIKGEQQEITTTRTSNESHLHWKKHFLENPLYFRNIEDFQADIEIDISDTGNKTIGNYKQNLLCNGFYIVTELEDVLKSGFYKSPLSIL